ncbi:hypothetical protein OEW28_10770 [Defluviimonas sp. WL0002]|uniref:Uncharacterized protein n=1 Tax=Albidovulum marisflavi TaxID=2984159 RepID=A0ABT2ZDA8_9RHOB|nr:hypothetical protein [Defluviimonas sp. WL0002]MCV2869109.1 hypothetical protein [Defluviimonas sp. WL0002]
MAESKPHAGQGSKGKAPDEQSAASERSETPPDDAERNRKGGRPAETEVPAGPGDAGASDVPERLKTPPHIHPARRNGGMLVPLLVGIAIVLILTLLF